MRIAFSGSHRVGKTTLLEAVASALPTYSSVAEPYHLLEEEGYDHADPPALEDFEAQLERSILALEEHDGSVLFDRCPADVLAYLFTHEDAAELDSDDAVERAREAMSALDLVVFVPIEEPDRIAVASHEDRRWRQRVHDKLESMLLDDPLGFEVEVLFVQGSLDVRLATVLKHVSSARGRVLE